MLPGDEGIIGDGVDDVGETLEDVQDDSELTEALEDEENQVDVPRGSFDPDAEDIEPPNPDDIDVPKEMITDEELEPMLERPIERIIDGKKQTKTLKEWVARGMKAEAVDARMEDVANQRKEFEKQAADWNATKTELSNWFAGLRNPDRFIEAVSVANATEAFRAAAEKWVAEKNRIAELPEAERKMLEMERKLEELKSERDYSRQQRERAEHQAAVNGYQRQYTSWIGSAMEATGLSQLEGNAASYAQDLIINSAKRLLEEREITEDDIRSFAQDVAKVMVRQEQAPLAQEPPKAPLPPSRTQPGAQRRQQSRPRQKRLSANKFFDSLSEQHGVYDEPEY